MALSWRGKIGGGRNRSKRMERVLTYELHTEDLERTAGGLVNLVLKNCIRVTGHEISTTKFTPGGITCDGAAVRVSDRMKPGQVLRVVLPEKEDAGKLIPTAGALRVLYEDEDLLAVDKPAGEAVHPCPGHYMDTTANHAAYYLCADGADASGGLRIAGRLDKEASGVLVFAKNRAAAARLQRQRRDGRFVRIYLAVCEGAFPEAQRGTISLPLEKVPGERMKMRVFKAPLNSEGGQDRMPHPLPAVTHYEVLAQGAGRSLLRISIETGRTHQIRVHMAAIGHPLVGDSLYGRQAQSSEHQKSVSAPQPAHTKSMPAARAEAKVMPSMPAEEDFMPAVPAEDAESMPSPHAEDAASIPSPCAEDAASRALLHAVRVRLEQPFTGEKIRIDAPVPADLRAGMKFAKDIADLFSEADGS